jgi:integrase
MARGSIYLREHKNGSRSYEARIRLNGRQRNKAFPLKKLAEEWLDKRSDEDRYGRYRELRKSTFGRYMTHWKSAYLIPEKLKHSTIQGYTSIIRQHLLPEFEDSPMIALDTATVKTFESRLLKRLSRRSVRNVLVLLGRILEDARKEHFVAITPMTDMDLPRVPKSSKGRSLTPDEIARLIAECSEKLRPIVWVALLAGLRRAEVFALHWENDPKNPRSFVDFDNNVIQVRQSLFFRHGRHVILAPGEASYIFQVPKSPNSIRDVPLSPALKRELLNLKLRSVDKHGLLFQTKSGHPIDPNNVCRWYEKKDTDNDPVYDDGSRVTLPTSNFLRAVAQADIGPVRFHDLRHSYGSHKLNAGALIYDVSRWMGHSSIQVTVDIYGHQDKSDRGQQACVKTDALLGL